jgi:translation initiation factor 2 subunit 1
VSGKQCEEGKRLLDAYASTKAQADREAATRALDAYFAHRPSCAICWQNQQQERANQWCPKNERKERKAEQKAEKIIETLATQLKEEPQKVYETVAAALLPRYEFLTYAFTDVVENNASLKEMGLDEQYATPLHDLVIDRIKPKQVMIEGDLSITSYAVNGLEMVKHALSALANPALDTRYLGAGTWRLIVTAPEYKDAEKVLKSSLDASQAIADKDKSAFSFKRKE